MAEYANTTSHAQQVGSGAFIPAFGTGKADPKDEHDAALITDGILTEVEKPKASRKSGEED